MRFVVASLVAVHFASCADAHAQALDPATVAQGLSNGDVAQTLGWVAVVQGVVVVTLAGALWRTLAARLEDLRASTAAQTALQLETVGLARDQIEAAAELRRAADLFRRSHP